jgi:chromatin structure-remodeling complex subunit SFH1
VTGLIQPENITGGPKERELFLAELDKELFAPPPSGGNTPRDSPAPFGPSRRAVTTTSGRRSRMVSYAEQGSDEDEEEDEEEEESEPEDPASDPEDGSYGGRGDGGGRRQRQRRETQTHGDLSKQGRLKKKRDEMDKGWTWLGDRCPGERVRSMRAQNTKHQYLYVCSLPRMLVQINALMSGHKKY